MIGTQIGRILTDFDCFSLKILRGYDLRNFENFVNLYAHLNKSAKIRKNPSDLCANKKINIMAKIYFEDKIFDGIDYSKTALPQGEYENCTFKNCIFNNTDLLNIHFADCTFKDCDLSMAKIAQTAFKGVSFNGCKMLGLYFEHCNPFMFAVSFDTCSLNLSSFYQLNLKKTIFKDCSLQEVDFSEADLTSAVFNNSDLFKATFDHTNLEKVDFRTAYNYAFDLDKNRIKKAKFSTKGVVGLLRKYDIEIS